MQRPLMQYTVGQLEEMFANGKADPKLLEEMAQELRYRQKPRAVALLEKVQNLMRNDATLPKTVIESEPLLNRSIESNFQQPDLLGYPVLIPEVSPRGAVHSVNRTPSRIKEISVTVPLASPVNISLEEAYKLLEATQVTEWQVIEQKRRTLVSHSHPSQLQSLSVDARNLSLAQAKKINSAYSIVAGARCRQR